MRAKRLAGYCRYNAKEKRQPEHIVDSEEARGKSEAPAKRIADATVNK